MTFARQVLSVDELRGQLKGSILTPADPDYEAARRGWLLTVDQYPAVIVIANDAQDVVAAVRFARDLGLGVSVQSTGHGLKIPVDEGVLIITKRMKGLQINAASRTARAEAGVVWEQVIAAAAEFGLAPLVGTSPHVGVMGYSLGGGIGWLARKYGLAADSVHGIEIVTPDGELRRASATENSDLFWGVRGSGGNFGVVTAIEFSLYPVATIYGGNLSYPGHLAGEVLRFYREWTKQLAEEMTSSLTLVKIPSLPQVPEEMRGRMSVILKAVYVGDAAAGAAMIQQWLDWQMPTSNTFKEMPFTEIGTVANDPVDPSPGYPSSEMLDELSDEAIAVMVRYATNPRSPLTISELRHAGGAITRADRSANAIGNRDAQFYMTMAGLAPTVEARTAVEAYIQRYSADLKPYLRGGVYLNFVRGSELGKRTKDAYSAESLARLVALKQQYDPANMFRYSYRLVE
ncbi:MAG: FAD-binding oxidoreductase [Anaerolineae bacterium]|nr:FAD-binding oxidoreductase [Anaerolineae bacterium]